MTSKTRGRQQVLGNTAPLFSLKRTEGVTKESRRAHLQHGPLMLSPHKQLDLSSLPSSLFPSFVLCLQFLLHLILLPILSVLHYVSLCTLKSLVWQAANSLHCPLHIFHATASGVRIWGLQKRMFCGRVSPQRALKEVSIHRWGTTWQQHQYPGKQHMQRFLWPSLPSSGRKVWRQKKGLLCSVGLAFYFLSSFSSLKIKRVRKQEYVTYFLSEVSKMRTKTVLSWHVTTQ